MLSCFSKPYPKKGVPSRSKQTPGNELVEKEAPAQPSCLIVRVHAGTL